MELPFLLEIGTEEIPDWMIVPAVANLRELIEKLLAENKLGERVTDKFYKVESFGRTLYHLLGIDPDTVVTTPANRPIKLIAEDAPVITEALA